MTKSKKPPTSNPTDVLPEEVDAPSQHEESTSSEQESDSEISFHRSQPYPVPQDIPSTIMPYIEGPKMDWTVNNGLYHGFLKWRLKCKNILECELAALPEQQKCKKVVTWSEDFGMDQYVSWCIPCPTNLEPDLTFLPASDRVTRLLMNGTMLYKPRSIWQDTLWKQPKYCTEISSGFL